MYGNKLLVIFDSSSFGSQQTQAGVDYDPASVVQTVISDLMKKGLSVGEQMTDKVWVGSTSGAPDENLEKFHGWLKSEGFSVYSFELKNPEVKNDELRRSKKYSLRTTGVCIANEICRWSENNPRGLIALVSGDSAFEPVLTRLYHKGHGVYIVSHTNMVAKVLRDSFSNSIIPLENPSNIRADFVPRSTTSN